MRLLAPVPEAEGPTRKGPLVGFLPILLVGILFGFAMDDEVFLVAGTWREAPVGRARTLSDVTPVTTESENWRAGEPIAR